MGYAWIQALDQVIVFLLNVAFFLGNVFLILVGGCGQNSNSGLLATNSLLSNGLPQVMAPFSSRPGWY